MGGLNQLILTLMLALLTNDAIMLVSAGTLIVSVDDVNLVPFRWQVHSVASRSWSESLLSIFGWSLVDSTGYYHASWVNTYTPQLLDDGSYRFDTNYGFWQNWLGAEMGENQLQFSYSDADADETYSGISRVFFADGETTSFAAGINCWMADSAAVTTEESNSTTLASNSLMQLECDNPSVNWDSQGTTTISVSMMESDLLS